MPQFTSPSAPELNTSKVNPATVEFIKQDQARRRKQRAVASVIGLVLIAGISIGGYFGYNKYKAAHQANVLKQIAAEIKPGQGRDQLRQQVQAGTITEDQAREIGRAAFEKEQQARIDGYFKTPARDRDKYLDAMIDEMQKRMAEWQKNRPTTGPTTRPNGPRNGGPTTRPNGQGGQGGGRGQQRADNTSPVQRAQQTEFRAAMQARMKARGIQMPGGRGGFGGGGGGGGGGRRG